MTPAESAAVTVAYSFIVNVFVCRELHPRDVYHIPLALGKNSAMILFIIATFTAFPWLFTFSGIPGQLVDAIVAMNLALWMFCPIIALVLLMFGTFLRGITTRAFLVPVFWSIVQTLGIGVIHFEMIMCIANVIRCMTPPVAINLFAAVSASKLKTDDIAKGELPFSLRYTAVFFLIVFAPVLSTLLL